MKNYSSLFLFTLYALSLCNNIFPAYLGLFGNVICVFISTISWEVFPLPNLINTALSFHAP